MTPPTRWSAAEFERLRRHGDPEIDGPVASHARTHQGDARGLTMAVIKELEGAKQKARGNPAADAVSDVPTILDMLGLTSCLPDWGNDAALIRRGQQVFQDNGLYQSVALFCVCLPLSYAEPSTAKVLGEISDLATGNLTRRVAETGHMLIDVMALRGEDSLQPGGPGHTSAIALRVLHSFVRALLCQRQNGTERADGTPEAPVAPEAPVNQELLLATLIDFSSVAWKAMERMGIEITDLDRAANLYTWSVFGYLMGVESCLDGPLTLADIEPVEAHLAARLAATEHGRRLMAALLTEMESFMYLGWRKLPRSLIRWLFEGWGQGVDRVPDLLGVPKAAWWCTPLFAAARAANRHGRARDPLRLVIRWLLRRAGRFMIIGFAEHYAGERTPFQIPPDLARRWRISRSRPARSVRDLRRKARQATRARTRLVATAGRVRTDLDAAS